MIVNLTPHPVVVRTEAGDINFPVSGQVARVSSHSKELETLTHEGISIPVMGTTFGEVENLPEADGNTLYIVSSLVRMAPSVAGRTDLVSPDTSPNVVIRDKDGKIVAVKGFQR